MLLDALPERLLLYASETERLEIVKKEHGILYVDDEEKNLRWDYVAYSPDNALFCQPLHRFRSRESCTWRSTIRSAHVSKLRMPNIAQAEEKGYVCREITWDSFPADAQRELRPHLAPKTGTDLLREFHEHFDVLYQLRDVAANAQWGICKATNLLADHLRASLLAPEWLSKNQPLGPHYKKRNVLGARLGYAALQSIVQDLGGTTASMDSLYGQFRVDILTHTELSVKKKERIPDDLARAVLCA